MSIFVVYSMGILVSNHFIGSRHTRLLCRYCKIKHPMFAPDVNGHCYTIVGAMYSYTLMLESQSQNRSAGTPPDRTSARQQPTNISGSHPLQESARSAATTKDRPRYQDRPTQSSAKPRLAVVERILSQILGGKLPKRNEYPNAPVASACWRPTYRG